jgi:DNA/RNA endonuclease YhcR with UshA esterase domain
MRESFAAKMLVSARMLAFTTGVVSICGAASLPARAETFSPTQAAAHVGETITVKATVNEIHTGRAGATFINMGGTYPDNAFTAVIFAGDRAKFPKAETLKDKTVEISGAVELYQGKPEIVLKSAEQLRAK